MSGPIPVALIGAGWVAEHAYAPVLSQSGLQLVGIYDPDQSRAQRLAALVGLPEASGSFSACLDAAVTGVILCTPPHLHAAQLRQCLAAGKFVLCEKPVLREQREIEHIASLGSVTGRVMGSATTRLRSDVALLLSWVRQGRIGRLQRVQLGWWRERGVPQPGSWRTDPALCPDGVFEDLAPHLLDIAAAVLPGEPAQIVAASFERRHGSADRAARWFDAASDAGYRAVDHAQALFETAGGVVVDVETCWTCDTPGDLSIVRFEGSRGTAQLRGLFGFSTTRRIAEQMCTLKIDGDVVERYAFPTGPRLQQRAFGTSLQWFARLCAGEPCGVAGFAEIAQVGFWMQAIREAARRGGAAGRPSAIERQPAARSEGFDQREWRDPAGDRSLVTVG